MVIVSVIFVIAGMLFGCIAFIRLSSFAVDKVAEVTVNRTGEQAYIDEFGHGDVCTHIDAYLLPPVTRKDADFYIGFRSCPAETHRILGQRPYDVVLVSTSDIISDEAKRKRRSSFLSPDRFGDSVLECTASEDKYTYVFFVSKDSTHVIYFREKK